MRFWRLFLLGFAALTLTGCGALNQSQRLSDLERENARLRRMLDEAKEETEDKDTELEKAQRDLGKQLEKYKAQLEMTERGLVITFLAEVFFDPGKDVVRGDGQEALDRVAKVLNEDVPDSNVAVEGHTDADPIKYSSWKSNWELSSARALAVLHYFIEQDKVNPDRLSANGYGEYRPVASNDTTAGKQKNRRVEIVILPSKLKKVKAE